MKIMNKIAATITTVVVATAIAVPVTIATMNNEASQQTRRIVPATTATAAPVIYLSGALRCTSGVWAAINDTNHNPFGITGVSTYSDRVEVTHAAIDNVGSFNIDPDETYVDQDVQVGASVGLDKVVLRFTKNGSPVNPTTICYAYSNVWMTGWEEKD
jgi:hypothetical protein